MTTRSHRLAAALLAAGLFSTVPVLAIPASAAPTSADAATGPADCHTGGAAGLRGAHLFDIGDVRPGALPFHTLQRISADRIQAFASVAAAPASYEADGPIVEVPFTYDADIQQGRVDVAEARAVLGAGPETPVLLRIAVDGAFQDCQAFGPSDDAPGEADTPYPRARHGMGIVESQYPSEFESTWAIQPGDDMFATWPRFADTGHERSYELVEEPRHGELHSVVVDPSRVRPDTALQPVDGALAYRPEPGFSGQDSFVLRWTIDGEVKTERVTVRVDEPRFVLDPHQINPAEVVWPGQSLHAAPDPSHDIPDTVETGHDVTGWAVGLAGAGLAATAVLRRGRPRT